MAITQEEQSKKHGMLLIIGSAFIFFALILLSQGWFEGWSLMRNISEIYLFELDDGYRGRRATRIHTKYFLVATLAAFALGLALTSGAILSPLRSRQDNENEDEFRDK